MKFIARLLLAVIKISVVILVACAPVASISEFPNQHQWTEQQKAVMHTLWIGSLQVKKDASNRVVDNPLAISLGHKLFFDKRFSGNGKIACASCHQPEKYFTDGLDTSQGIAKTNRNAPTIVASSHSTWFFRDGREDSLWSQALGPLENELEHGGNRGHYAQIIFNDPDLRKAYESIFGEMPDLSNEKRFPKQAGPVPNKSVHQSWDAMARADQKTITEIFVNIGKVVAAYETILQLTPSRFDLYVKAVLENNINEMQKQLSSDEAQGLRLFISQTNCTICHSGPLLTDESFHNISVPPREVEKYDWGRFSGVQQVKKSPFNCRGIYNDAVTANDNEQHKCDELEYMVMDRHETMGAMKTPSLRNVAKTAPYMHAGQYKTLTAVIKHYINPPPSKTRQSELFLKVDLNEQQIKQLEAFLISLNSPINAKPEWLRAPN